jgi:rsbT co-antagonist protein RsbR
VTGLSSEVAQTLVTIGVELGKINAMGDLQSGMEEAERCSATTSFSSRARLERGGASMRVPILR